jgi:tetratricopeptide (TPR) repeat protein
MKLAFLLTTIALPALLTMGLPAVCLLAAEPPPAGPQAIIHEYIWSGEGKPHDPAKGLAVLAEWFQANRQTPLYLSKLDEAGQVLGWAFMHIDDPSPGVAFFEHELTQTTDPKAIYLIHAAIARLYGDHKEWAKAIDHWETARRAMMGNDQPYFTYRQAAPLLEIAKLHQKAGDDDKAIQSYEAYYATDVGQKGGGDLYLSLGPLYEARGEWKKAKDLYEHFLAIPNYARDERMRDLLPLAQKEDYDKADALARDLTHTDFAKRRQAFRGLRSLFDEQGKPSDWVRWLDARLRNERDAQARTLLATLRQNVAPLEYLGDDPAEPLPKSDDLAKGLPASTRVLGGLFQAKEVQAFMGGLTGAATPGKPWRLSALCANEAYHRALEEAYVKIRTEILAGNVPASIRGFGQMDEPKRPAGSPPPAKARPDPPDLDEARAVLKESPDARAFLRAQIAKGSQDSGIAVMLLYSLGNPDDIPFLADHLPDTARLRGQWFWLLAAAVYREGAIDIPEALGLGDLPQVDWWNARVTGAALRQHLHAWWDAEKGKFKYDRNERAGQTLVASESFGFGGGGVGPFAAAPELNGVFWLNSGGGMDYGAQIDFLDLATGRKTTLIEASSGSLNCEALSWSTQQVRGFITNLRWNAKDRSLEFCAGEDQKFTVRYEDAKPTAVVAGRPKSWTGKRGRLPTIIARDQTTYEVRAGNLYKVDEQSGAEECLLRYGYVLGVALSQDGRQAAIVDRDIPGPALWLVPLK